MEEPVPDSDTSDRDKYGSKKSPSQSIHDKITGIKLGVYEEMLSNQSSSHETDTSDDGTKYMAIEDSSVFRKRSTEHYNSGECFGNMQSASEEQQSSPSDDAFVDYTRDLEMYKNMHDSGRKTYGYNVLKFYKRSYRKHRSTSVGKMLLNEYEAVKTEHNLLERDDEKNEMFNLLGYAEVSGSVGKGSIAIPLTKKGFYTVFLKNSKTSSGNTAEICCFRVRFKYSVVCCRRDRRPLSDDAFGDENFKIRSSGDIYVGTKSTKIILIYADDDCIVEFSTVPSIFESNSSVFYKICYSGMYNQLEMPLSLRFGLRVLSLDSTDNLGTSIIGALYALEGRIGEISKSEVNLVEYFDYICGTNTGALVALCLLKGYSIKELKLQWQSIVSRLFKWRYSFTFGIMFDHCHVDEFIKTWIEVLGTDFMINKPKPHCMVTCTNVNSDPYELFLFRSYTGGTSITLKGTSHVPMWLAGWASCALPTYIRGPGSAYLTKLGYKLTRKSHFVDGSIVCSNPSLVALQELTDIYNMNLRELTDYNLDLLLSIGTCKKVESASKPDDIPAWKILLNRKNFMSDAQIKHIHVKHLFPDDAGIYHRIELPPNSGCKHGKTSKSNVDFVLNSTISYINSNKREQIEKIAELLHGGRPGVR